ncbi:myosin heavy chain kinase [Tieghemostelium lacteum]|uniref:Myosin heavy chain kinase n=1 Tax=Tieghemostelium lacteum TaxID=361077 RepID=A0A151ZEL4_TIELA|nr:myosin heavy chain kinase [Tieghemostelium lacteum]|eukprot:KYQ92391.1 myosin heavy chain kinase [Tieghemostelium lacteum]
MFLLLLSYLILLILLGILIFITFLMNYSNSSNVEEEKVPQLLNKIKELDSKVVSSTHQINNLKNQISELEDINKGWSNSYIKLLDQLKVEREKNEQLEIQLKYTDKMPAQEIPMEELMKITNERNSLKSELASVKRIHFRQVLNLETGLMHANRKLKIMAANHEWDMLDAEFKIRKLNNVISSRDSLLSSLQGLHKDLIKSSGQMVSNLQLDNYKLNKENINLNKVVEKTCEEVRDQKCKYEQYIAKVEQTHKSAIKEIELKLTNENTSLLGKLISLKSDHSLEIEFKEVDMAATESQYLETIGQLYDSNGDLEKTVALLMELESLKSLQKTKINYFQQNKTTILFYDNLKKYKEKLEKQIEDLKIQVSIENEFSNNKPVEIFQQNSTDMVIVRNEETIQYSSEKLFSEFKSNIQEQSIHLNKKFFDFLGLSIEPNESLNAIKDKHEISTLQLKLNLKKQEILNSNTLILKFITHHKNRYIDIYYIRITTADDGSGIVRILDHTIPYWVPLEQIKETYLNSDFKLFCEVIQAILNIYTEKREEFNQLQDMGIFYQETNESMSWISFSLKVQKKILWKITMQYENLITRIPAIKVLLDDQSEIDSKDIQYLIVKQKHQETFSYRLFLNELRETFKR